VNAAGPGGLAAVARAEFGHIPVDRRKKQQVTEPGFAADSWRAHDDGALLAWLHSLPAQHDRDEVVLEIVGSRRHIYVRQVAAAAISNPARLRGFMSSRDIGPLLTRPLSRVEDLAYLADLAQSCRYPEVRRLARNHLEELTARLLRQPRLPTR
jgi:hypothetical protein